MLLQNPQLAYALLQAQVIMRIVDPATAVVSSFLPSYNKNKQKKFNNVSIFLLQCGIMYILKNYIERAQAKKLQRILLMLYQLNRNIKLTNVTFHDIIKDIKKSI